LFELDNPKHPKDDSFLALVECSEPFPVAGVERYGDGMTKENKASRFQGLSTLALIVMAAALLAMGWITTALAQTDSDGDGFDGDELSLPILLGVGVLAYGGWLAYRRRGAKSRD
jgi:hypothetical protein